VERFGLYAYDWMERMLSVSDFGALRGIREARLGGVGLTIQLAVVAHE